MRIGLILDRRLKQEEAMDMVKRTDLVEDSLSSIPSELTHMILSLSMPLKTTRRDPSSMRQDTHPSMWTV